MADKKYYCFCGSNCRYETMTKEQILTAIEQAVKNGKITDIDAGFVSTLKEQNKGAAVSFWLGTTAEYNAIAEKQTNCFYIITDDTSISTVQTMYAELLSRENANAEKINGSSGTVKLAETLNGATVNYNGDIHCNVRGGIVHLFGAVTVGGADTTSRECFLTGNNPTMPIDELSFNQRVQINGNDTSLMVTITPQGKINFNLSATDTEIKLYINMMYTV